MQQLYESDGNGNRRENNINHFASLYESDNKEGTQQNTKSKTPKIVTSENNKGRKNKGCQNKNNEEDRNDWEKKTKVNVYDFNSDKELNGDFITAYHDDASDNDKKERIPRKKVRPIKKNNKNKPYSQTVKETSLRSTHNKDTNKEYKDETMYTIYNKEEDKYEEITLDYKPSIPDSPNPYQVIDSDD